MAASWQQIAMNLHQVGHAQPLLPFILFAIGIAAMAWVVRRTALKLGQSADPATQCLSARSYKAHAEIDEIASRQWLDKQATAVRFSRDGGALTAPQLNFLARVSSQQRVHGSQR